MGNQTEHRLLNTDFLKETCFSFRTRIRIVPLHPHTIVTCTFLVAVVIIESFIYFYASLYCEDTFSQFGFPQSCYACL